MRSASPTNFLARGARLGANTPAVNEDEALGGGWAGVAKIARAAASVQWNADGAAAWLFDDRSSKPPACFAPPPARDGENNLTFAKASVMFSLSPSPKFIFLMQLVDASALQISCFGRLQRAACETPA